MVYNAQNQLGLWTLAIVRNSRNWKTQCFGNWNSFRLQVRGRNLLLFRPLKRAKIEVSFSYGTEKIRCLSPNT
jgi:hypothetical protein